jgi:predicted naringenin-chalcone synthase
MGQMTTAYLNRIGTAVPRHDVHETFVRFADTLLQDPRLKKLFGRMADRSGIAHRYSTLAPASDPTGDAIDAAGLFSRGRFPSTGTRMGLFEVAALPLAMDAVGKLDLGDRRDRISHLIVTTCTGLYAPGLDMQVAAALGLRPSVERSMVAFMGCYAAFNALKLARHIVRSEPEAQVLVVNLELCTLHLQETQNIEQVLSFLVFADGCAASLITAEPVGIALDRFHAALIPKTEGLITWRVGDQGFDMHLSGRVPGAIGEGLAAAAGAILDGADIAGIDLWAVHPGGRSVLDSVTGGLALAVDALTDSRAVLRDYGNMSSATIMFVLARMMKAGNAGAQGCAMGFGPGLVAETMLFSVV